MKKSFFISSEFAPDLIIVFETFYAVVIVKTLKELESEHICLGQLK